MQNPIDLPQIAVVGSQSSGKSSVLENIVGRDLYVQNSRRRRLAAHTHAYAVVCPEELALSPVDPSSCSSSTANPSPKHKPMAYQKRSSRKTEKPIMTSGASSYTSLVRSTTTSARYETRFRRRQIQRQAAMVAYPPHPSTFAYIRPMSSLSPLSTYLA